MPHFPGQGGGYAEYVTGPSRHFARKPAALSHQEAAGLPLVGLTAWQALAEVAELQPGERVLVHAAAGGLGHVAVQIAKALGAYVIGTASAAKHELLRALGVDEPIDYRATDFAAVLSGLDAALVTIPGDTLARSVTVVRDGGTVVSIVGEPDAETAADAAARDIRAGFTLVEPDRHGLLAVSELVEAGKLRPVIAEVLPLAEAARAHRIGEEGRTTGKLSCRCATGHRQVDQQRLVVDEAVRPRLAGLDRADQRVLVLARVAAGVLVRRRVAAPHLPAAEADAQVDPAVAGLEALLAAGDAVPGRDLGDLDLVEMGAGGHAGHATPRRRGAGSGRLVRLLFLVALAGVGLGVDVVLEVRVLGRVEARRVARDGVGPVLVAVLGVPDQVGLGDLEALRLALARLDQRRERGVDLVFRILRPLVGHARQRSGVAESSP